MDDGTGHRERPATLSDAACRLDGSIGHGLDPPWLSINGRRRVQCVASAISLWRHPIAAAPAAIKRGAAAETVDTLRILEIGQSTLTWTTAIGAVIPPAKGLWQKPAGASHADEAAFLLHVWL